ncbi:alpha/beta fold hydrolase [Bacillus sp. Marseille-P3661]|uniref:alpha/beta fold hydrolase n=1 Tax=Bacillus sp. Marseille-P3661 TaxID=1936234 RepID=UPI0021559E0B|nr:alpha/beta hydrolase [Bacillus sp. Marseille-P3661]
MNSIWTNLFQTDFSLKFYNVNGVRTRCLEAGEGEPLILLHGVGGHLEAYASNIAEHAKDFHVYAIDMIGHGFTDKPTDEDYTIPYYVNHLLQFMDELKIEKASISGESLGGWVGAWFASEYPERIHKLVLNTSAGITMNPQVMEKLKTLTQDAVYNATKEKTRKRLEFLMYDKSMVTDELVDVRYSIYAQPSMSEVINRVLCLQEVEIRKANLLTEERLASIKAPTCVIWTTHDPTASPEIGEKLASLIPNSEYHLIENCGHWPQYETTEEFNRIHKEFLLRKI